MQQGQGSYAPLPLLMDLEIGIMLQCGSASTGDAASATWDSHMAALDIRRSIHRNRRLRAGALLRLLDTLAEWQMRHSHSVISRVQTDSATITGVTQPSSANERSSISPCDR